MGFLIKQSLEAIVGNALYAVYVIIIVGVFAAIGIPLLNGYFSTNEKVSECARILDLGEQNRCFRDAEKQAKANADFGKAVGSVLSGDSTAPTRSQ